MTTTSKEKQEAPTKLFAAGSARNANRGFVFLFLAVTSSLMTSNYYGVSYEKMSGIETKLRTFYLWMALTWVVTWVVWQCLSSGQAKQAEWLQKATRMTKNHCPNAPMLERKPVCYGSMVIAATAALVMHAPGLFSKLENSATFKDVIHGILGSLFEGYFLLLVFHKLFSLTRAALADSSLDAPETCARLLFLTSATTIGVLASAFFLSGDYSFQVFSGGETADMWVLAAGYKAGTEVVAAQFTNDPRGTMWRIFLPSFSLFTAFVIYSTGPVYWNSKSQQQTGQIGDPQKHSTSNRSILATCLMALIAYALGCWSPVLHAPLSFLGTFIFSPDGATLIQDVSMDSVAIPAEDFNRGRPNVIYLWHESLSGVYGLKREEGRRATPFLQSMKDDEDFYSFNTVRSVSGDTTDALTVLATGCLPVTKDAYDMAFGRSIGTEFKKQGYNTASFSSRMLNLKGTKWHMLHSYLTSNFDHVFDPGPKNARKFPVVNAEGADDRHFVKLFKEWVKELNQTKSQNETLSQNETQSKGPSSFYAQFYQFNTHWPYLKDENCTGFEGKESRLFCSIQAMDDSLRDIFSALKEVGQLDNTIIVGSGDHGEFVKMAGKGGGKYARLSSLSPHVLTPLSYMYIPKHLLPSEAHANLRTNAENRTVSTLDFFPTVQNILYGGNQNTTSEARDAAGAADPRGHFERERCVTGFDLIEKELPPNRVAVSWNTVSGRKRANWLGALSTEDDVALYINQNNKVTEFVFDECTSKGGVEGNQCDRPLTKNATEYWRNVITQMKNSSLVNEAVRNSVLLSNMEAALS